MTDQLVALVLGLATLFAGALVRPRLASCPVGWTAEGIPPDGFTICRREVDERAPTPPERLPLKVYCEPGERAVLLDNDRLAGCRSVP